MFVDDKYDLRKWINFNTNLANVFWLFRRVELPCINHIREKVRSNGIQLPTTCTCNFDIKKKLFKFIIMFNVFPCRTHFIALYCKMFTFKIL